jgi:hypothetical protein
LDRSAVVFCYLADDGQSQAGAGDGAGRWRTVEAVENVRQVLRRDTGAVVPDGELGRVQAYLDGSAGGGEFGRVVQQVPDRDLDAGRVTRYHAGLEVGQEDGPRPVPPRGLQAGRGDLVEPDLRRGAGGRLIGG